ncbi:MAG: phage major capsid protein [Bacteroidales bacterium]|jgi:HK97 family phage major capsid protein|nr:phage major capsid protein [Bacteroidales bacterium]
MTSLEIKDKKNVNKTRMRALLDVAKKETRELTETEQKEFDDLKKENETLTAKLIELQKKLMEYEDQEDELIEETEPETKKRSKKNQKVEFRLLSMINKIANNRSLTDTEKSVIEAGISEMKMAGLNYSGQIVIPTSTRAITVNESKDTVGIQIESILQPLRAKNVLFNAGAKYLSGLQSDVQVPVMGASSVNWAGEIAEGTDAGTSFTNVKLSPKRLTAYLDVSKQFLAQSSEDAEASIRQDIVNAISTKLESTILGNDDGTDTQPAGIFSVGEIQTKNISTYNDVAVMNALIDDTNVLNERSYVLSNKAKAYLRSKEKGTVGGGFILQNNEIDGEKVFATSNVNSTTNGSFVYGDFSNLIIGEWSGIDLVVDPYTQAKNGSVRLVINAYFDAKIARTEAFVNCTIGTPEVTKNSKVKE